MTDEKKGPAAEFSLGKHGDGCKLIVWKNGDNYSFQFKRSWKNKDGEWQEAKTYFSSHLPYIAELCRIGYNFVLKQMPQKSRDSDQPLAEVEVVDEMPF